MNDGMEEEGGSVAIEWGAVEVVPAAIGVGPLATTSSSPDSGVGPLAPTALAQTTASAPGISSSSAQASAQAQTTFQVLLGWLYDPLCMRLPHRRSKGLGHRLMKIVV